MHTRALVLGAGGLVGTAWTAGLAAGLRRSGLDPADADLFVGTSAGAITAALLATGRDPDHLATPPRPAGGTPPQVDGRRLGEAFAVLRDAAANPDEARRRVGRIALAAETGPEQAHIDRMHAMIGTDRWPSSRELLIPVTDAETGAQTVFSRTSDAPLAAAVAASTAFPGIYPPITVNGRRYLDGSLHSATNAALATGARTLVVVDPQAHLFPRELLHRELAAAAPHTALTIEPDQASLHAFGPDLNDRTAWAPAYAEGLRQGAETAEEFRLAWKTGADADRD
ncbi:patatin-like phospholipase family protein [Kitasatospora sp. CB01950]|uniref:patatin-like phospholipase family protein n=1 Tax=Kitasatospora sp. CB01950 TaxID=1703930 RepID=UPI00093F2227|nr:patatin-like phospholipase family protein [Kitasatospora sp. CB01950]